MENTKVCLISLGCEKNLVDSEMILGLFKKQNVEIVQERSEANIIIVNTCGFITPAKEEAINTIMDCIDYKQNGAKVIVTGCLVERYENELKELIPEVDLFVPIRSYYKFGDLLKSILNDLRYSNQFLNMNDRLISTPNHLAYVKISEGCNNRCTYCAIPLIRGSFKSRNEEDIIQEITKLVNDGYKEICLISQDLTNYGSDINTNLADLLKKIEKIPNIKWVRMLYLYPDEISDDLIMTVKNSKVILPYFDIPIQHASDKILDLMHRRGNSNYLNNLFKKIKDNIKDVVIRTTLIVGFPEENDNDFEILKDFIKNNEFNHLGTFTYSKEEDTVAFNMKHQVPDKKKKERYNEIMDIQRWISLKLNRKALNKVYDCIIESFDSATNKYYGRNFMFAPDDIDGEVIIDNDQDLKIGEIYKVEIYDVDFYDLFGKIKNK